MKGVDTASYGGWPSPISAPDVARAKTKLSFPTVTGTDVWWMEEHPEQGGRITVMRSDVDGDVTEMLPSPWNARSRVHTYGGRSYLPIAPPVGAGASAMVFVNFDDQRIYLHDGTQPRPLTPEPTPHSSPRYADIVLSSTGDELWCVREEHDEGMLIRRGIVAVPLDGSAASDPGAVRLLVGGADFYAFPTPSPDGRHLAWVSWNHPRMPWDGTELFVSPVDVLDGKGDPDAKPILGGEQESVLAPVWRDASHLYVVSDSSGWWNLYVVDIDKPSPLALCPREEEFAGPLWQLGTRPYAVLGDGRIAVVHGQGGHSLGILDPRSGKLDESGLPGQIFQPVLAAYDMTIAGLAGDERTPWSVVRTDVGQCTRVLRSEAPALPDASYVPSPRHVRLSEPGTDDVVHAIVYPPTNPDVVAPDGELAPYIVWAHGGPTSCSVAVLDLEKAFFTSRGIGIIDVNYRGSCGYGRQYRERLRGQWGVIDVADAMAAAKALVDAGEADPERLGIRGASAGAWTAMVAVTTALNPDGPDGRTEPFQRRPVFAAAVSYFGVTDRVLSAATTHDYESRYVGGLIGGRLPEAKDLYLARSPRGHVSPLTSPMLLLQGLQDPVVVPQHAELIARELAEHNIPYAHITFPNEAHGFRHTETIVKSLRSELSFYGQVLGFTAPGVEPVLFSDEPQVFEGGEN